MSYQNLSTKDTFDLENNDLSIAIVCSTYHDQITNQLLDGALRILNQNNIKKIYLLRVPGAYELVSGSIKMIQNIPKLSGIITLGCVIKGDTDHDIYINHAVAQGLVQLQIKEQITIGFGLLTTNDEQQAIERTNGVHGNKGEEVAWAVLQTIQASFEIIK